MGLQYPPNKQKDKASRTKDTLYVLKTSRTLVSLPSLLRASSQVSPGEIYSPNPKPDLCTENPVGVFKKRGSPLTRRFVQSLNIRVEIHMPSAAQCMFGERELCPQCGAETAETTSTSTDMENRSDHGTEKEW